MSDARPGDDGRAVLDASAVFALLAEGASTFDGDLGNAVIGQLILDAVG